MAVHVDVDPHDLVVEISGWDALWALSGGFRVPLRDVRNAVVLPRKEALPDRFVLRLGGTSFPGLVVAGRYGWRGYREFWATRRPAEVLVVTCAPGAPYERLVLQTAEPERDARMVLAALR